MSASHDMKKLNMVCLFYCFQIALGTVTNVEEAVKWMSYTYLFVRLQCNPLVYGVQYKSVEVSLRAVNICHT